MVERQNDINLTLIHTQPTLVHAGPLFVRHDEVWLHFLDDAEVEIVRACAAQRLSTRLGPCCVCVCMNDECGCVSPCANRLLES